MIKSIQHVNITVSNLDEAIHFFCDILGLEILVPVQEIVAEGMRKTTQIPDARVKLCILKTRDNNELELTQYLHPKGKIIDLKVCNIGVFHLAFEVDDIMQMYRDLSAKGIVFYHPPLTNESGPFKGRIGCYMKGPDGVTIELLEFPKSIGYS